MKKKRTKKLSFEKWLEKIELKIYDEQYKDIKINYGKRVVDSANYGWGSWCGI